MNRWRKLRAKHTQNINDSTRLSQDEQRREVKGEELGKESDPTQSSPQANPSPPCPTAQSPPCPTAQNPQAPQTLKPSPPCPSALKTNLDLLWHQPLSTKPASPADPQASKPSSPNPLGYQTHTHQLLPVTITFSFKTSPEEELVVMTVMAEAVEEGEVVVV